MLAMGRALMGKPKLLMLDEPSLGLAPLIVREIFSIIVGAARDRRVDPAGRAERARRAAGLRLRLRARDRRARARGPERRACARIRASRRPISGAGRPRRPAEPVRDRRAALRPRMPGGQPRYRYRLPARGGARRCAIPHKDSRDRSLRSARQRRAAWPKHGACCSSRPASTTRTSRACSRRSTRTKSISPTSISSTRGSRAGASRKASSSRARSASTAASAIRAVHGDKQAFAYSDDITPARARRGGRGRARDRPAGPVGGRADRARRRRARALRAAAIRSRRCREDAKVALLERLERMARARDPRVTQVMASLAGEYEAVLIARSDGFVAADVRPLVRVSLTVIVEENGRREQGSTGGGGRFDYDYFTDEVLDAYAKQAVDQALLNLGARDAPAGHDDGRARPRLAGHPAARGDRPRARGRLQPQGHERVLGPRRPARRGARASPSSTTARSSGGAARSTSTTRATRRSAPC